VIVQTGVQHDYVVMCSEEELEQISNALDRCLDDENVHPLVAYMMTTINNGMARRDPPEPRLDVQSEDDRLRQIQIEARKFK
jgi:hypothetical protein